MAPDFSILREFLERCGSEAEGHALPAPSPELASKLDRFARGECSPEDRVAVCDLLRTEPVYLRVLANRVKDARGGKEPGPAVAGD